MTVGMVRELFWGQSSAHAGSFEPKVGVGSCDRQHGVIEQPTGCPAGLGHTAWGGAGRL